MVHPLLGDQWGQWGYPGLHPLQSGEQWGVGGGIVWVYGLGGRDLFCISSNSWVATLTWRPECLRVFWWWVNDSVSWSLDRDHGSIVIADWHCPVVLLRHHVDSSVRGLVWSVEAKWINTVWIGMKLTVHCGTFRLEYKQVAARYVRGGVHRRCVGISCIKCCICQWSITSCTWHYD